MRSTLIYGLLLTLWSIASLPPAFCQQVLEGFSIRDVNTTLIGDAVGFDFLPDGRILQIYKNGSLRIIAGDSISSAPILVVPDLTTERESGLVGIAVDPDFPDRPYVYLFHTHLSGTNWISRFTLAGDLNNPSSINLSIDVDSQVVLKNDIVSDNPQHHAGTLRFGRDKTLFASLGDDHQDSLVQDLTTLNGKIIRINRDGTIPLDNPTFPNEPATRRPEIFAFGLRNPFRFQIDPLTDRLLIGDVGEVSFEELDLSTGGENFGWPRYEGNLDLNPASDLIEPAPSVPILDYPQQPEEDTFSVIPLAIYRQVDFSNDFSFPNVFEGALFYCDFGHDWIRYLRPDGTGGWVDEEFATGFQSLTDGRVGPDGALYVLAFGGALKKIIYTFSEMITGLSSYTAVLKDHWILIRWNLIEDSNSAGFAVQRSLDGGRFEDIGFVEKNESPLASQNYKFGDLDIPGETIYYRLKRITDQGTVEISATLRLEIAPPSEFILRNNFPNPFNPSTTISYFLPIESHISLKVYNLLGQLVRTLVDRGEPLGNKTAVWDGKDGQGHPVNSGVYLFRLEAANFSQTKKLIYLR